MDTPRNSVWAVVSAPGVLSLTAALFFAGQHPLSKPALSAGGEVGLIIVSVLFGLLGIPVMLLLGSGGKDLIRVLTRRDYIVHLLVLGVTSWTIVAIYVTCIGSIHPVIAAIFLNTSPLWSAIWTTAISRQPLPRLFWLVVTTFFVSLVAAAAWKGSISVVVPPAAVAIVAVPALYTFRSHMLYWWFPNRSQLEILASGSIASALMSVIPFVLCRAYFPTQLSFADVSSAEWLMMLAGSTCLVLGSAFYQLAIKAARGNSAYVAAFSFLMPSFSAIDVWLLYQVVPEEGLKPDPIYFLIIGPVTVALAAFAFVNERARRASLRRA